MVYVLGLISLIIGVVVFGLFTPELFDVED